MGTQLDLAIANGHIRDNASQYRAGATYAQRNQLFRNVSRGRFVDVSRNAGAGFAIEKVSLSSHQICTAAAQQNIDFATIELQTVKVAGGLYVLIGGPAQGNIAVSVGSDGVFLVEMKGGWAAPSRPIASSAWRIRI